MESHETKSWSGRRNRILWTSGIAAQAALLFVGLTIAPRSRAQTPPGQSPFQSLEAMEAAGTKMAFDVTSVKPNKSDEPMTSLVPLDSGSAFTPTGGHFLATNQTLFRYLMFAYRLRFQGVVGVPDWVNNLRFDIEARSDGNPTKDQYRLMMQSLLADRFHLVMHKESQQKPVYAVVLTKPGKTGPQLQIHRDDQPCSTESTERGQPRIDTHVVPSSPSSTSGLQLPPMVCGSVVAGLPTSAPKRLRVGGKNITMDAILRIITIPPTGVDRPVIDRTGLNGTLDFSLEWSPAPGPAAQAQGSTPDDTGPTFREALQEQLGLKLQPLRAAIDVYILDHVEEPSPN